MTITLCLEQRWNKQPDRLTIIVFVVRKYFFFYKINTRNWKTLYHSTCNMQICKVSCRLKSAMRFLCNVNSLLKKHTQISYSIWDRSNGHRPLRRWTLQVQTSFQHRMCWDHCYGSSQLSQTTMICKSVITQSNVCHKNM